MAAVPPQGNKKVLKRLANSYKKHFFRYGVFTLLLIELLSIKMVNLDNYTSYWYPLMTQIALFIMVFPQWVLGNAFKYCTRKKLVFMCLSLYYLFGAIYLITGLKDSFYYDVISGITLFGSIICAILTVFKDE